MRIEQFEEDLAKAKIEKEQMQASYQSKIEVNCFKSCLFNQHTRVMSSEFGMLIRLMNNE